ncbi:MAG: hypothetical protein IPL32_12775 [Chloracidobacterium sp.]|nr:hypothetical protein [Chloracidobacterium sp.]
MNKKFYVVTVTIFLMFNIALAVRAQSALDGFDPNANGIVQIVVVQPDGKILIGGDFTMVKGISRNRIARLNPDGTVDTLFDPNASAFVGAIALQADGKILVGGSFNGVNSIGGQTRNRIARLDAVTGQADLFNPNADAQVYTAAVQADGQILVGGDFGSIGGQTRSRIARLNPDGTADSFNPAVSGFGVGVIVLQSDGKILVGGTFSSIGGQARSHMARLDPTTGLADSFNPNVSPGSFGVSAIAVQADGKVLAGGVFTNIGGQPRNHIARLDAATGLADSFNPNPNNIVSTIVVQPDGEVLVGGDFGSIGGQLRVGISRLDPSTGLADSFNPNGDGGIRSIAVQPDGKILAGGDFTTFDPNFGGAPLTRNYIARLEIDGRLDRTLNLSAVGQIIYALAVQPDGKILIGGTFTQVFGVMRNNIARLNTDGTLDTTFNPNAAGQVFSIVVQPDGKILVGGTFTSIGGQTRNRIARLDTATGLADSFNPNANDAVFSIAVQTDGKVVLGGVFYTIGGVTRNRIARVDPVSGLTDSFDPNATDSIPIPFVQPIKIQADGKILVGGFFNTIGGETRNNIARLDAVTGAADSFTPNAFRVSEPEVNSIAVQQDGKILAGGFFTGIGGQSRNYIARLDAVTGAADSWNPSANFSVMTIAMQADATILAGGLFSSIGGQTRNGIARLDSITGLADSFDPSANGGVYSVAVQSDGKILTGGNFSSIGGQPRNLFARLSNAAAALQNLAVTQTTVTWTRSGSSPQLERVTFESSTDNVNYTPLGNGTATGDTWSLTGLNLSTGQNIYIRARGYYRSGAFNGSESIAESVRNAFLVAGPTATTTNTPTNTATATQTNTPTLTPTSTSTNTPTPTPTAGPCTVVTNTNDSGSGSLRDALNCANTTPGGDTITFNIVGAGVQTISPLSALPVITEAVTIDGTTQPGFSGTPLIELNGTSAGGSIDGLSITAGGSTIRALIINNFGGDGIQITAVAGGNTITGCYIGTNAAGTASASNDQNGILINGSPNNVIGGTTADLRNIISGNGVNGFHDGVEITGEAADGNQILGNYIGLGSNGTTDVGNAGSGVRILSGSDSTVIGGTTTTAGAAPGNVISGNGQQGIYISGATSTAMSVRGNIVGLQANGTIATGAGNAINGIWIEDSPNNIIGSTLASGRNIISNNAQAGVQISVAASTGNLVQGNYIGTNSSGTADLGNITAGVLVNASGNTIGGTTATPGTAAGNVISGNNAQGVNIGSGSNQVQGNIIGLNASGTTDLGNSGDGVIVAGASNTIGGATAELRNIISGNDANGIQINAGAAVSNSIASNYIGTDITGTLDLGNTSNGVLITVGASSNNIGGLSAAAGTAPGNVISGNNGDGVELLNVSTTANLIRGNMIGTSSTGAGLGNGGHGVFFNAGISNTLGGTDVTGGICNNSCNIIGSNALDGVFALSGTGNAIKSNFIRSNGGLGIDLGVDGVTANDTDDPDPGANNLQNFPVITSAVSGDTPIITGTLNTTPNSTTGYRIDFFENTACDGSGNGEGQIWLGSITTSNTDSLGNVTPFGFAPAALNAGNSITATATDGSAFGNTSEFSACFTVVTAATPTATATATPTPAETPSISGTVTYGNPASPTTKFISNATVASTVGSPLVTTVTDAPGGTAGQYTLTGFGTGNYTIGVTKTTGQNGVSSADAARIAQHVSGVSLITNDRQRIAADVTNNGALSSTDAAQIARFVSGLGPPIGLAGQWRFFVPSLTEPTFPIGASPTTRSYADPIGVQTGQDYIGILVGEVTGNWNPTAARPFNGRQLAEVEGSGPERGIAVELPSVVGSVDKEIVVPVTVEGIANKGVISYEFDLRYDPSVIQPVGDGVDVNGTVSRRLSVVTNATEPGLLRVVVYGAYPIEENGLLLNLRFTTVGASGSVSPISFERIVFNEGEPRVAIIEGKIELL